MKTFTQILASINWVDVAMLVLMIRIIFIGVKTGFVTELFKLLGIFVAVIVGLHYYTPIAVYITKLTNWPLDIMQLVFFVFLVSLAVIAFKYLREGFLMLFKFETTHAGINQWGAGVLAVLRAWLIISLVLFGMLLTPFEWLKTQTFKSISKKLTLKAAPGTYSTVFNGFIGKIFTHEKFNDEVLSVISNNRVSPKKF
jgi:uncharacterized membrane protein required for colicin V production